MCIRDQIIFALKEYAAGKYDTKTFCDVFIELYFFESSGYRFFSGKERCLLDELAKVIEMFSPSESEVTDFSYFSEQQVKNKFNEIINQLDLFGKE